MARPESRYVCGTCGATSLRWEGQCRSCGEWNTLVETPAEARPRAKSGFARSRSSAGDYRPQRRFSGRYRTHPARHSRSRPCARRRPCPRVRSSFSVVSPGSASPRSAAGQRAARARAERPVRVGEESAARSDYRGAPRRRWRRAAADIEPRPTSSTDRGRCRQGQPACCRGFGLDADRRRPRGSSRIRWPGSRSGGAPPGVRQGKRGGGDPRGPRDQGRHLAGPKTLEHLVDVVLTFEGDRFGGVPTAAGGQEPVWLHRRGRRVRDDVGRPDRGLEPAAAFLEPAARRPRRRGGGHARRQPPDPRRGPGAVNAGTSRLTTAHGQRARLTTAGAAHCRSRPQGRHQSRQPRRLRQHRWRPVGR